MAHTPAFQETIEYLYALQKHGIKLALSNSVLLMELAGNPHCTFPSVHVAGTNGKGSTSAFIANMLQSAGYRVGLYTSPHLVSFTERMRINGTPVDEARVVALAARVRDSYQHASPVAVPVPINPTFFEVTTTMAFQYFAEEAVDIAVIEVGMGGRLDSTNVILPKVSVITNIDREHTEYLGETLTQIAQEKAGIIKPGVPVVTGVDQPEVIAVVERTAASQNARVYRMPMEFSPEQVVSGFQQRFDYRGIEVHYQDLRINMLGSYQVKNACLALAAVECLRDAGMDIDETALRQGLLQTRWEGRLERVSERPDIYLDGAHNPASANMLRQAVKEMRAGYRKLVLVIGILGDKDYRGILAELVPLADAVVVTKPDYGRAMSVAALAAEVRKMHASVNIADTLALAIDRAREMASSDDLILVTGSLYVVGDARALFQGESGGNSGLTGLKG